MTLKQKNTAYGIIFILVALILIFGVRAWKMNKIESLIESESFSGLLEEPISVGGEKYLISPASIYDSGNQLPAVSEPQFASIAEVDSYLADDVEGIDIEVNGQHRFYSYQILNWHEVVRDNFDGISLAVTHCVFCKSSSVYKTNLSLENSGKVYNNNQLLADDEGNLWSQIMGVAVVGKRAGDELEQYPFNVLTWSEWKELYPNGSALTSNTGYERDYTMHPYGQYDVAKIAYFPLTSYNYHLAEKAEIKGFDVNGEYVMVSDIMMSLYKIWNGTLGESGYAVFYNSNESNTKIFLTNVDDKTLTFTYDYSKPAFIDDQTKSVWNFDGLAISGDYEGTQLEELTDYRKMFAMCWATLHPGTQETMISADEEPDGEVLEFNQ